MSLISKIDLKTCFPNLSVNNEYHSRSGHTKKDIQRHMHAIACIIFHHTLDDMSPKFYLTISCIS